MHSLTKIQRSQGLLVLENEFLKRSLNLQLELVRYPEGLVASAFSLPMAVQLPSGVVSVPAHHGLVDEDRSHHMAS